MLLIWCILVFIGFVLSLWAFLSPEWVVEVRDEVSQLTPIAGAFPPVVFHAASVSSGVCRSDLDGAVSV